MMHYYPELVKMEYAGVGATRPFAIQGLNEKVAWLPRDWSKVSADTGIGDPGKSTPEKGRVYAAAVVAQYVRLIVDLCRKEMY